MVGVDDWCWTVYCCVDVYFGSKESPDLYDESEQDAPLGGTKDRKWPVWNPRDYFLKVLSVRVAQITREWGNVLCGLEERLRPYVGFNSHLKRKLELTGPWRKIRSSMKN
jgi:hypothetical protein